jgi:cytochrome c5
MKSNNVIIGIILLALAAGVILAACGTSSSPATSAPATSGNASSSLDGQALLQQRCSVCHSVNRVTAAHKSTDQWTNTVNRMVANGAQLSAPETRTLIDYLAKNFN